MGKTGSVEWVQIRGRKGQMRLVPGGESTASKPGPGRDMILRASYAAL